MADYDRGQSTTTQRYHRFRYNEKRLPYVKAWCQSHRWDLKLHNHNQHWRFTGHGYVVDWYPSTGECRITGKRPDRHYKVDSLLNTLLNLTRTQEAD